MASNLCLSSMLPGIYPNSPTQSALFLHHFGDYFKSHVFSPTVTLRKGSQHPSHRQIRINQAGTSSVSSKIPANSIAINVQSISLCLCLLFSYSCLSFVTQSVNNLNSAQCPHLALPQKFVLLRHVYSCNKISWTNYCFCLSCSLCLILITMPLFLVFFLSLVLVIWLFKNFSFFIWWFVLCLL